MFDAPSPLPEFLDECLAVLNDRGFTIEDCPGIQWVREQGWETVGEFVEALKALPIDDFHAGWGGWVVVNMRDQLPKELYQVFLDRACMDEMTAFQCFVRVKDTEADEDDKLRAGFEGKLPTAERELQSGEVVRRKAVTRG